MNKLRKLIISRFVDLQTLMGESYKEGITIDEINAFLSDKKFADLSTGAYVDKNKYENEIEDLKTKLGEKDTALKSKMTDEEKQLFNLYIIENMTSAEVAEILKMNSNTVRTKWNRLLAKIKRIL